MRVNIYYIHKLINNDYKLINNDLTKITIINKDIFETKKGLCLLIYNL